MTLASETNRTQFDGDDSTTSFPITWIFYGKDELLVTHSDGTTETVWTRGSEYTVTGGAGSTGTVDSTAGNTVATGSTLTVTSNLADTQPLALAAGGAFPSASVETQLDKLARLIQQKAEQIGRSLLSPISSAVVNLFLPVPAAGKGLGWNSAEDGIENITLTTTSLSIPLTVASGGTAGVTATAARTNLGVNTARRLTLYNYL